MNTTAQRLQKVLANAKIGSRREIESMISAGKISVNGKLAILGTKVSEQDVIKVNNKIVRLNKSHQHELLLYHKKVGEICTRSDPENRKTVFANLPKPKSGRWISVGRLDINTSGLMIFTTDGNLANKLMHPSSQVDREYAVRIFGKASDEQLQQLKAGVAIEGGIAKFSDIVVAGGTGANNWYHVVLRQGKNREIRKAWEFLGLPVSRLIRVRFGPFELAKLRAGKCLTLSKSDEQFLLEYLTRCQN